MITRKALTQDREPDSVTSYTTATITPAAGALVIACVHNRDIDAEAELPSLSGCGLVWTPLVTAHKDSSIGSGQRVTIYAAQGSPTPGAVLIDVGDSQTDGWWSIDEFHGAKLPAVPNVASTTVEAASSLTLTLPNAMGAGSAIVAAVWHDVNEPMTPLGNEIVLHDTLEGVTDRVSVVWEVGDNAAGFSWATADEAVVVAIEIAAVPVGTPEHLRKDAGDARYDTPAEQTRDNAFRRVYLRSTYK